MDKPIIRSAAPADADALLKIYEYYVKNTAVTFEITPPTLAEFEERITKTLARYPYLAAERDGAIVGYAYAGPLNPREAYACSAEVTVYVDPDRRGEGIGRALYGALEEALAGQGITNIYACIASTGTEDEYLTDASERFHARMGYVRCGKFTRCGRKFGRSYDMIWMEKFI